MARMKKQKRFKNHLQKSYEHLESARTIIQENLENETIEDPSILVHFKLKTLDAKLLLKGMLEKVDKL